MTPVLPPVLNSGSPAEAKPRPTDALAGNPGPSPAPALLSTATVTLAPGGAGGESEGPPADGPKQAPPATRLASHLFVPVGESRDIHELGELLETIHLTEPPSLTVGPDRATLTAQAGGISCLRFHYRDRLHENNVQTLCVVSFDEAGSCSGLEPVGLDLRRYLEPGPGPFGNADLLESGRGLFYAACLTPAGAYRLQQPDRALPPLYFTIVDALTDGPYSLGDAEMDLQRAGTVVTFAGAAVRPPWIVSVSREVSRFRLTDDARIEFNDEDCDRSPSCTVLPDALRLGDLLRISVGISIGDFSAALTDAPEAVRDRFFRQRIGLGWPDVAAVHPDAAGLAFARLASLDLMGDLIAYFDALHGLREKGVIIGYWQPWPSQNPLPFPFACFPDDIVPGEGERCRRIEEAIQKEEARRIAGWLESGYDLWYAAHVEYAAEGEGRLLRDARPDFSRFNGVIAGLGAHSGDPQEEIPAYAEATMRQLAAEVGPETPVVLALNGPPPSPPRPGAPSAKRRFARPTFEACTSRARPPYPRRSSLSAQSNCSASGSASLRGPTSTSENPMKASGASH
jgi:hypothetical protein